MSEEVKEIFEYTIGNTVYTQKKMTLGQIKMMNKLFGSIELPSSFNAVSMFSAFSGRISEFMSIVLCKKGTALKDKDPQALIDEFDNEADLDTGFEVVQNFFDCNPIAFYFEQMMTAFQRLTLVGQPKSVPESGSTEQL